MEPVKGYEGIISKISDNLYYNHCTGRYVKSISELADKTEEVKTTPKKRRMRKIKGVGKQ